MIKSIITIMSMTTLTSITITETDSVRQKPSEYISWLATANTLGQDPSAVVQRPSCGQATLNVKDVPAGINHIDREIRCPACGRMEALFMRVDAPHHEPSFANRALRFWNAGPNERKH